MAESAFIEIETDFEYVSGQMNEKAARFLMDFYNVEGQLEYTLKDLAIMLKETALDYLELNGIPRDSNLGNGIEVLVRGHAIEMRSTAYVMPTTGKIIKNEDGERVKIGHDMIMRGRSHWGTDENGKRILPRPKKGHNHSHWYRRNSGPLAAAANMIMPQGVDYVGATGGHYSLWVKRILNSDGDVIGHDSHARRYVIDENSKVKGTKNVVYYGAHVEFGHKTRDGGGIGFVQARPHLRPALRTVADASTGMLSQTMAYMLYGLGNTFDSILHQKQMIHGLNFGNVNVNQQEINQYIRGMSSPARLNQLRKAYSVHTGSRKGIQFGKKIDYRRYGYDDETRQHARKMQRNTSVFLDKKDTDAYVPPRRDWLGPQNKSLARFHLNPRYKYPNTLPERTRSVKRKAPRKPPRKIQSNQIHPTYLGRNITHGHIGKRRMKNIREGNYKHRPRVIWGGRRPKGRKRNNKNKGRGKKSSNKKEQNYTYSNRVGDRSTREPNHGGADPLRPATWEDFMVGAKPQSYMFKGWSEAEINAYKESYKQEKINAQEAARQHNEKMEFLKKAKWYEDRL